MDAAQQVFDFELIKSLLSRSDFRSDLEFVLYVALVFYFDFMLDIVIVYHI